MSVQARFWEIPVTCSDTEGECKDGIPWPTFPESTSVASRCMPNLKPASTAEAPGLASGKIGSVFQCAVGAVPWLW